MKPKQTAQRDEPRATFTAQTIINSLPDSIQIIVPFAPQVSIITVLTLDQVKEAMARCLQMRTQQPHQQEAPTLLTTRKDLHA